MVSAIKNAIALSTQTLTPTIIWGGAGVGKTSFTENFADVIGVPIETIIASIRDPSDFAGLPVIREDGVEMFAPSWAKRLAAAESNGLDISAIGFFDEVNTAPPATQAAFLRVFNDRWVGDFPLPKTVGMMAAANPPEMAAGGWVLAGPLANRLAHFEWNLNSQDWAENAISGWEDDKSVIKLPSMWRDLIPLKVALIGSFIRTQPAKLYVYPKSEDDAGKAWPSPRTWIMAARFLAAVDAIGGDKEILITTISGAVGNGPAVEFINWIDNLDLPDPEELLKDPDSFKLPKRHDQTFAILSSVTASVLNKMNRKRWDAGWIILAAAAKQSKSPDIAAFAAKSLAAKMSKEFPPPKEIGAFTETLKEAGLL